MNVRVCTQLWSTYCFKSLIFDGYDNFNVSSGLTYLNIFKTAEEYKVQLRKRI